MEGVLLKLPVKHEVNDCLRLLRWRQRYVQLFSDGQVFVRACCFMSRLNIFGTCPFHRVVCPTQIRWYRRRRDVGRVEVYERHVQIAHNSLVETVCFFEFSNNLQIPTPTIVAVNTANTQKSKHADGTDASEYAYNANCEVEPTRVFVHLEICVHSHSELIMYRRTATQRRLRYRCLIMKLFMARPPAVAGRCKRGSRPSTYVHACQINARVYMPRHIMPLPDLIFCFCFSRLCCCHPGQLPLFFPYLSLLGEKK